MLAALIEAAIRSLILASVVWAGLRIFRIHSVVSQRCAWMAVLIGSLLMPFALPFIAHGRLFLIATIPSPVSLDRLQSLVSSIQPASMPPAARSGRFSVAAGASPSAPVAVLANDSGFAVKPRHSLRKQQTARQNANNASTGIDDHLTGSAATLNPAPDANPDRQTSVTRPQVSIAGLAVFIYFVVAAALLLRLFFGLVSAMHLWRTSTPIPPVSDVPFGADLNLRSSRKISAPVTIGSGIVLPAGYKSWPDEKVRIVLAHERSHVRHHDFHVQMLASLYAALTWFSPLGWWLKHKLYDLGEAISDGSSLNAASNRSAYAQILLEFAAAPRPTLIGVAMARNNNISHRIERLLNDNYLRHAFSGSVRARAAFLVIPVVLFAAAAMVRVQAASQTQNEGDKAPQFAQKQTAMAAAEVQLESQRQAITANQKAIAKAQVAVAAAEAQVQAQQQAMTGNQEAIAKAQEAVAAAEARLQAQQQALSSSREFALATPPAPSEPPPAMENGEGGPEATFDRNLTFNGKLELTVGTGSGNITLTRGPANQIHIHGIVKANHDADPGQVQQIAANPPITQEGNTIRIGGHGENQHNISISYEIEAPADTDLNAATGSGNISDTGVGHDAKLTTGSGNIMATGLEGDFKTQTGSGNIAIDDAGQGNAKAQTGSGNIELKGVHGTLDAQTGSGRIKAEGTPSSPWKLQAGSGNIELATGNAPINLDASTSSGKISTNPPIAMETPEQHHHLHTQLNGGGPEVRVETGSGDIRVD